MCLEGMDAADFFSAECTAPCQEDGPSQEEQKEQERYVTETVLSNLSKVVLSSEQKPINEQVSLPHFYGPMKNQIIPMIRTQQEEHLRQITRKQAIAMGSSTEQASSIQVSIVPGKRIDACAGPHPLPSKGCRYLIFVKEGALEKLNNQELEALIGHEVSHIAHGDRPEVYNSEERIENISDRCRLCLSLGIPEAWRRGWIGNVTAACLTTAFLLLNYLARDITTVIVQALRRKNEFRADLDSARINGSDAVKSLLLKLEQDSRQEIVKFFSGCLSDTLQVFSSKQFKSQRDKELCLEEIKILLSIKKQLTLRHLPLRELDRYHSLKEMKLIESGKPLNWTTRLVLSAEYYRTKVNLYAEFYIEELKRSHPTTQKRIEHIEDVAQANLKKAHSKKVELQKNPCEAFL